MLIAGDIESRSVLRLANELSRFRPTIETDTSKTEYIPLQYMEGKLLVHVVANELDCLCLTMSSIAEKIGLILPKINWTTERNGITVSGFELSRAE